MTINFIPLTTETKQHLLRCLHESRQRYPEQFQQTIASDPEVAQFIHLL